ncbi:hypothetical protein BKA56DRAFT_625139 [Ilyonectria sp. MPI-CAGE-AT-0026]|nr:hypothetical protein BKA56DRAFT_625139 [Ilyonectria sp. MPI-CAGE-AT-0026]
MLSAEWRSDLFCTSVAIIGLFSQPQAQLITDITKLPPLISGLGPDSQHRHNNAWADLDDGFHLSSPKLQDSVNLPSPDAMEPLVNLETNWSSYQPPEDRLGDFDGFLSGLCSGVDAGRITGYTECLQACLAGLLTMNQSLPTNGAPMEADGHNDHVDYGRRCGGDLSPTVLTLSEDQIMRLFADDDNFPQEEIGVPLPAPCGENCTQQGEGPDDLTADLCRWTLHQVAAESTPQ